MPASFIADLCGYRSNGHSPNTSDATDPLSVELGRALFAEMGVPGSRIITNEAGAPFEKAIESHLATIRPDLRIGSSDAANFDQYSHLKVFRNFAKEYGPQIDGFDEIVVIVENMPDDALKEQMLRALTKAKVDQGIRAAVIDKLIMHMPAESILKIDVAVSEKQEQYPDLLHVALSCKWSLRTDRAQDCVSQGAKLVAQRRGRMPHFAVITIEPRPAMLKILGDGSGAIDCVYHPNLPALQTAIGKVSATRKNSPGWKATFDRLIAQGRIRDYDDLVREVQRLPGPAKDVPAPVPQGGEAGTRNL